MTNITNKVRDFLNKNPQIVRFLGLKLINVRALAFYVLKESEIDASLHAVMSAIRRYIKESMPSTKKEQLIQKIYSDSKISTKSHLVMLTVNRHFSILKNIIPDLLGMIHVSKGEVLRIVEGREAIKFIVDHSKRNEVVKLIPKEELVSIDSDLGEVNIHLSEKYGDTPGLISPIFNELAINDINITEVIGCMPELIFIIKEKDISACHDVLLRFLYR